jgi:hypothetical protein
VTDTNTITTDSMNIRSNYHYDNAGLVQVLKNEFHRHGVAVSTALGHLYLRSTTPLPFSFTADMRLRDILGFDEVDYEVAMEFRGSKTVDVNRGLPKQLFVYSDLIEPQFINNSLELLLRIVPVDIESYKFGCAKTENFSHIQYLKVNRLCIDSIEIHIKDSEGQFLPFQNGTLTVTLHLIKRNG